ncbi:MAG TPA: glycerate kinase [Actinomycetaceae bacterium]|nr:glycerate kinase [Actinomycetaceae bacterium]
MRVLVAAGPMAANLPATQVGEAIAAGWRDEKPATAVNHMAMSDGSRGFLEAVHAARGGDLLPLTVPDPLGAGGAAIAGVPPELPASVLHVPGEHGGTAYLSADQVIGLDAVPGAALEQVARRGSSAGLGDLLAAAMTTGASRLIIGMGEAASHDAGFGMAGRLLQRLGMSDAEAPELLGGNDTLRSVDGSDITALHALRERLKGRDIVVAAAHDRPLFGLSGSGAALAQRPGIDAALAQELDRVLGQACDHLERHLPAAASSLLETSHAPHAGPAVAAGRRDGSGSGGGAAVMLEALGARVLPGPEAVATLLALPDQLAGYDVVITTCDALDPLTLHGSIVAAVAAAAADHALPVVVLAQRVQASRREMAGAGIVAAYATGELPAQPLAQLHHWGARLARTWALRT